MKNSTVLIFSLRKVYFGYQILQGFQLIFGIAGVIESRIFSDKTTGSNLDREGLKSLMVKVEEGDAVLSLIF